MRRSANRPPRKIIRPTVPLFTRGYTRRFGRIVQQLAEGKPLIRIKKAEKVSADTVTAILKREGKTVDAVQKMTAGLTSYASQACLMNIIEKLEKELALKHATIERERKTLEQITEKIFLAKKGNEIKRLEKRNTVQETIKNLELKKKGLIDMHTPDSKYG